MYDNWCKSCNHEWTSKEREEICPNCQEANTSRVGSAYRGSEADMVEAKAEADQSPVTDEALNSDVELTDKAESEAEYKWSG
jgi:hypothetical protein